MQCLLHRHLGSGAEDLRELVLQPVVVREGPLARGGGEFAPTHMQGDSMLKNQEPRAEHINSKPMVMKRLGRPTCLCRSTIALWYVDHISDAGNLGLKRASNVRGGDVAHTLRALPVVCVVDRETLR